VARAQTKSELSGGGQHNPTGAVIQFRKKRDSDKAYRRCNFIRA
jgi:hypothetical protein